MAFDPILNVYSGEEGLADYFDPDKCPPVPLVELPERLNPYRADGVRIYAKLMSVLPATNVKSLPALNMLQRAKDAGKLTDATHTIVEYSSGSTVISLAMIASIMGIPRVKAYLSNKTSTVKLNLLRFFGLELKVFPGHGQPEPLDENGGIFRATVDGQQEGWYNPDQYSNPENYEAHVRWTGPQILKQLPEIRLFAACVGTTGTMTGSGLYIKEKKPSVVRLGVCPAPLERVPGPRMFSLLGPVEFPWRDAVDGIEEIGSFVSFEKSLELCRSGILVGPSSGLALLGIFKYIEREKEAGRLGALKNENGEIPCVFICCDQPFQYIQDYMDKLGPSYFPPIENSELLDVDLYSYNVDWEISPKQAHAMLFDPEWKPPAAVGLAPVRGVAAATPAIAGRSSGQVISVLDLRDAESFYKGHIPGAVNLPVDRLEDPNPYADTLTMVKQFRVLDKALGPKKDTDGVNEPFIEGLSCEGKGKVVFTLSHRGNMGRLAMSVLRERGIQAHCVMGGTEEWKRAGLWNW